MFNLAKMVLAAVLAATTGQCSQPSTAGPGGTVKGCDTTVSAPAAEGQSGTSAAIVARAVSECDHTPTGHVVHVQILREGKGGFDLVGDAGGNYFTSCEKVPTPGHSVTCERRVPCLSGTYRTKATVTGDGDGRSFAFTVPEEPVATVQCPKRG